jgi:hypothetical protein
MKSNLHPAIVRFNVARKNQNQLDHLLIGINLIVVKNALFQA